MPFAVALDGTRLAFEVSGTGKPLLLLSGQGQDRHMWRLAAPLLARQFQVICMDYRGTGTSDKPQQPAYSTRGFAADAIAVLDALGIAKAAMYGISMGGRVCQWLGIDYPERISALVLGATTPGKHGVPRDAEANAWLQTGDIARITPLLYSAAFAATHPECLEPAPTPAFARRLHYLASEAHDTWELLPQITAPTLILHGDADRINPPENARLLATHIPHAHLHWIKDGRHGYVDEHLQAACDIVSAFLHRHI